MIVRWRALRTHNTEIHSSNLRDCVRTRMTENNCKNMQRLPSCRKRGRHIRSMNTKHDIGVHRGIVNFHGATLLMVSTSKRSSVMLQKSLESRRNVYIHLVAVEGYRVYCPSSLFTLDIDRSLPIHHLKKNINDRQKLQGTRWQPSSFYSL